MMEFSDYRKVLLNPQLVVDTKRKEKMTIYLDVEFPRMPCFCNEFLNLVVGLDVMDVSGDYQNNVETTVTKMRIDKEGKELGLFPLEDHIKNPVLSGSENECGSCYGAEVTDANGKPSCCNSCGDVKALFMVRKMTLPDLDSIEQCVKEGWTKNLKLHKDEGCKFKGTINVNKVPGNIHFAAGQSFEENQMHMHDLRPFLDLEFDFSHKINLLSFGEPAEGIINPLDKVMKETKSSQHVYKYFLKVVSTEFNYANKTQFHTNQFAVTQHEEDVSRKSSGLPGVFFSFDISPMIVIYNEQFKSFSSFITSACAIIGGVFTIAKILDNILYQAEMRLAAKREIGKAF